MSREIRSFVYGREYIPTSLAGSSQCRLLIVTDDQIEVLRNLVNYAHRRNSWNDGTIDSDRYYLPSDEDWDTLEALVDDLEGKLMSDCDYVKLDDENERVGIGVTPSVALDVESVGPTIATFTDGEGLGLVVGTSAITLDAEDSITLDASELHFQSAGDDVLTVIEQVGGAKVGVGLSTFTANGARLETLDGITFPASQVSKSNVNTLDDYEEGSVTVTLTPQTSGSIALKSTNQTLQYTKVGRLVCIVGMLQVNTVSSPVGVLRLGGLPFAAGSGVSFRAAGAVYGSGLASGATTALEMIVEQGQTYADVYKFAAGANTALAGDIQANSTLVFSCSYFSVT